MSIVPTPQDRFEAAALLLRDKVMSSKCDGQCALERAYWSAPPPVWQDLKDYAKSMGFTADEAIGIMNGWDKEHVNQQYLDTLKSDEYKAGYKLGQELCIEARKAGLLKEGKGW